VELNIFKKIANLFRKTESILNDESNTDSIEGKSISFYFSMTLFKTFPFRPNWT
jgi:hypothetical protein